MRDSELMRLAADLADEAIGVVSPRPPVGAIVTDDQGRVVGRGFTQPSPGPHAEVVALGAAGLRARGGTLYVTLEPCSHTGATPPCTEAILDAGVARVVAACRDANPLIAGRGFRRLRTQGVEVSVGAGAVRARDQLSPFFRWITSGRPLVTLKLAASLDGKVAAADGASRWITGAEARHEVHELRARVDAVMVGAGTVATDDPQLTARLEPAACRQPLRVVVDSSGRTNPTARIFDGEASTVVITTTAGASQARTADIVTVARTESGCDLGQALDALGSRGVTHLLVEGGPTLAASLVAAGLVDRLILYFAPILIGGEAPGIFADGVKTLEDAWPLQIRSTTRVGPDLRIDGVFG